MLEMAVLPFSKKGMTEELIMVQKHISPPCGSVVAEGDKALLNDADTRTPKCYRFLVRILVMAWRIVMPAFSISFLDNPSVTHTFNAGDGE